MPISDRTRLTRIDEEILNLEYLYTRELMREQELNKKNLLLSHGFKYRLDNLKRARAKLCSYMVTAPTIKMNYTQTIADKKNEVVEAEEELDQLKKEYVQIMANVLVSKDDNTAQRAIDLAYEIKVQQRRIKTKEDAVMRFITRGSLVQERKVTPQQARSYNPEKDKELSDYAYTLPPGYDEQPRLASNEAKEVKTVESVLGRNLNWDKKAENNATLDLITPPNVARKKVVIDFDE